MKKYIAKLIIIFALILNIQVQANSEDFYDIFYEHASVMILVDLETGDITHANQAAADFYGYTIEQLESMNMRQIYTVTPEEAKKMQEDTLEKGKKHFIVEHRLANGEIRTVEVYCCIHNTEDMTMLFATVFDITEKMNLEKRNRTTFYMIVFILFFTVITFSVFIYLLIKNYRKLKLRKNELDNFNELRNTFINSYDSLIFLKDDNFKYVFVNEAFKRFHNKDESEIIGKDDFDIFPIEIAEKQRISDENVLKEKAILVSEIHSDDKVYKATKFPVKLLNGNYGVGAYIEDITESYTSRKIIEKNLYRNQILVDVLSQDFESTQVQLDYVLNEAIKLTESKFGYIYLYNEETKEFILNSWSNDVMKECAVVEKLTKYQLEKTGLWGEVVRQRQPIIVNNYEMPNSMKKGYPEGHVKLTKFMSIPVIIDNRIVAVVGMANKEYDYDNYDVYQIITLMNGIWNAKGRREALVNLAVERNRFLQTLVSIGDGVLVVDLEGKVTMINKVAETLTGWSYEQAIGKHYKEVFMLSHEYKDHTINDPIADVLSTDKIQELGNNAMLISKNGSKYFIEDSAAPIKDDKNNTIGVVLIFRDVTEKKVQHKVIEYLSYHDPLTGLYNRSYFEQEIKKFDIDKNLPISVIIGDMNGLKLANDIFGHEAGDLLLKELANVLREASRAADLIARVGGDEFTILLPKTNKDKAKEIATSIKNRFSNVSVKALRGSISLGYDTKSNIDDDLNQVMRNAETMMYSEKTLDRTKVKSTTIKAIIDTLHKNCPYEQIHSHKCKHYC